jgi:hypothetical protein
MLEKEKIDYFSVGAVLVLMAKEIYCEGIGTQFQPAEQQTE